MQIYIQSMSLTIRFIVALFALLGFSPENMSIFEVPSTLTFNSVTVQKHRHSGVGARDAYASKKLQ